jgi:uncharacterized membrane protein YcaP (DUF421 family)
MDPVTPFDWQRLFIGSHPPLFLLEIILRVILIYGFAVFMLRYMGKRGQRQMTPFELLVVIALGSATGDSMFYPEVPILYAWLIILIIVTLNRLLDKLQTQFKSMNLFLEGQPRLLVHEGKILTQSLEKEHLRREELMTLLREQQVRNVGEIHYAFLEQTGHLGLIRYDEKNKLEGESTFPPNYQK